MGGGGDPSYGQGDYQAPGYQQAGSVSPGYPAPGYQAPGYPAPGYQAPGYPAPGYGAAPGYQQAPGYPAPGYQAPGYPAPGYQQAGSVSPGYGPPPFVPMPYPGAYQPMPYGVVVPYGYQIRPRTNGMAIAALICSLGSLFYGFSAIPAVILGFIGLRQVRRRGEEGHGLAIAGIVIGFVGIAFWALIWTVIIVHINSQPNFPSN